MTSSKPQKIVSLTYHEITEDPRVLKEARALRQAGYDVTVFCDWPQGLSEHDDIDGVKIRRFRCYDYEGVRKDVLNDMRFLHHARAALEKRFSPYAQACEDLKAARPLLEKKLGADVIERVQPQYFKSTKGVERWRKSLEYYYLNIRLWASRVPVPRQDGDRGDDGKPVTPFAALRSYRTNRRKLYQAESIVYHANFPEVSREDDVAAVHAHDIYCLPAGVMLAQKLDVPLIYDAHEYEPARASKMAGNGLNLPEQIEKDCFPFITRMIAVSDGIGELYAQRFQGPRPSIIMNAPEISAESVHSGTTLRPGVKSLREQVALGEGQQLIVFTGLVLGGQRGADKIVEALAFLPSAHFVLMGPREAASDKWLLDIARKHGVEKRVSMLAAVDARDVPAVISSATLSVAPIQDVSLSYRHCMPNKLFEAAFAGIPICVSDLPEMKHFVEDLGIGRVMDQTDPKAIAQALQDVFDHRDEYLLTPEAEQKLIDVYSWQTQAAKLVRLYRDVLGRRAEQ